MAPLTYNPFGRVTASEGLFFYDAETTHIGSTGDRFGQSRVIVKGSMVTGLGDNDGYALRSQMKRAMKRAARR